MNQQMSFAFRRPSKAVTGLLVGLLLLWIVHAMAANWVGGAVVFQWLTGDSVLVFRGQIWRLLTAALLHVPQGTVSHIIFSLLMLFFFAPPLEDRWGTRRLFVFLALSAVFAFFVESLFFNLFGVGSRVWLGGMVFSDACIVAWALGARNQSVRLFFVLPISAMAIVGLMVAYNVLRIIAQAAPPEGLFAPFAAMAAGYLFGADQSPVRRLYLKWKLRRLQAEVDGLTRKNQKKSKRRNAPHLQVIPGGRDDDDDKILH